MPEDGTGLNQFLLKQKDFLFEKQHNDDLEWQDLTDMRSAHFGVAESRYDP